MRRGYTAADFRAVVDALRRRLPEIAISTDLLCGFSGEDEDDHRATLALMRELRFDSAFMFVYSPRDGTYAAKRLPDDVAAADKKRRIAEIVALQEQISTEIYQAHVGRRLPVLVHARSRRSADRLVGRTDGFKAVILPADAGAPGALVDVLIERATMATLFGRPVAPSEPGPASAAAAR
jgi:tRNA-2-methylthio-N6-dimethylallyladenosine synthase